MKATKRFWPVLALAAVLAAPSGLLAAEFDISLFWPLGKKSLQWQGLTRFMDGAEARSDGRIKFNRLCCGQLGGDLGPMEQVRTGALDIIVSGVGVYSNYHAPINMIVMPGLFRDYDHVWSFATSPLWDELVGPLEQHGLKPLAQYNAGFRDVFNTKRPIRIPEDVQGLQLKTGPIKVWITLWEVLGASPQPMPVTEHYMAVKMGVVDGAEMSMMNTRTNKFYEIAEHYTVLQIAWIGPLMTMNLDRWNSFPPDIQQILIEEARKGGEWTFKEGEKQNLDALKWMEAEAGMKVVWDPDRDAFFDKVVKDVYPVIQSEPWYDASMVERIRALK